MKETVLKRLVDVVEALEWEVGDNIVVESWWYSSLWYPPT